MKKILFWLSAMVALLFTCTACEGDSSKVESYSVSFKAYNEEMFSDAKMQVIEYDNTDRALITRNITSPQPNQEYIFTPSEGAYIVKIKAVYEYNGTTYQEWYQSFFVLDAKTDNKFVVNADAIYGDEPSGRFVEGTYADVTFKLNVPSSDEPYETELAVLVYNDEGEQVGLINDYKYRCTEVGTVTLHANAPMCDEAVALKVYLYSSAPGEAKVDGWVQKVYFVTQGSTIQLSFDQYTEVSHHEPTI